MKSNKDNIGSPLPPEFELPREAVVPEAPAHAVRTSSGYSTTDALIARAITKLTDKEEYVDEL